jgi:integrase
MLSLLAGLRASEIFRLEIKDLDEERGMIFLKTPKKQKSQRLVLGESALSLLARLKENHPTGKGLFFTSSKGHQIAEVSDTVQRVIDHLGFNAGITDRRDKLTFHSWRHTYATWMLDSGVDIYTVNQLLRHSSLKMTERYVHPQEQKLRLAAGGIGSSFKNNGSDETG